MLEFHTLDVFTNKAFTGNPLAVVLGADGLTSAQMLTITREFNLSETIFVQTPDDPSHSAKVRIFHQAGEMPFAGHPTVGCAILLAELANHGDFKTLITLEEVAGLVPVNVTRSGGNISAEFTAPVIPVIQNGALIDNADMARALGLEPADIGFNKHKSAVIAGGPEFIFVPLASRTALAAARVSDPYFAQITAAQNCASVYIYCRDGAGFSARMFAPADGMPEDPATGSASAIFAAQLLDSGDLSEGENVFSLTQGVDMGRPSQINLSIDVEQGKILAVRIKGSAVRMFMGEIRSLPLAKSE
ncbi:MAG: PhzF family phenazine biosynthesis protein [Rhodobacteraceae bacterium]|nr:PhzF family phenazine biosynthesis protein [Paracoccaceae bacterium]